jgi:secondary thiamine-phosphate synthase enzyme
MGVHTHRMQVETRGEFDLHDITSQVQDAVRQSGFSSGIATMYVTHTTTAVVIGELETGLLSDYRAALEQLAPADRNYYHNVFQADDNAHSHLLGTLLSPSETVPFSEGRLLLGTWQRIAIVELDTHPRSRRIIVQIVGE